MHQFLNYFGLIEHQFLAKREVPSGRKLGGKLLPPVPRYGTSMHYICTPILTKTKTKNYAAELQLLAVGHWLLTLNTKH
jgi:hypothetical protein